MGLCEGALYWGGRENRGAAATGKHNKVGTRPGRGYSQAHGGAGFGKWRRRAGADRGPRGGSSGRAANREGPLPAAPNIADAHILCIWFEFLAAPTRGRHALIRRLILYPRKARFRTPSRTTQCQALRSADSRETRSHLDALIRCQSNFRRVQLTWVVSAPRPAFERRHEAREGGSRSPRVADEGEHWEESTE